MSGSSLKNALPAGTVLHNYIIESILGNGGFGIVYKARHITQNILVELWKEVLKAGVLLNLQ